MKNLILLFSTLFSIIRLQGQDNMKVVESIRERYYHINGGGIDFVSKQLDNVTYYLLKEKLTIVKETVDEGKIEVYYDYNSKGELYPYFIYMESNNKAKQVDYRVYFDENMNVVYYKEGDKEEDVYVAERVCRYYIVKAKNYINCYINSLSYDKFTNDTIVYDVQITIDLINKMDLIEVVESDNSDQEFIDEPAFTEWTKNYMKDGKMVMSIMYNNSECCERINKKYYKDNTIIYEYDEAGSWAAGVGNCIITKTYFKMGIKYRKDEYLFAGEHCDARQLPCPKITYDYVKNKNR